MGSCTLIASNGSFRKYAVVLFVDSPIIDVFVNWLIYYTHICANNISSIEIVSMDSDTTQILTRLGLLPSSYSFDLELLQAEFPLQSKLTLVGRKRMHVLAHLLESNIDVVMTDSNAIWQHDPLPFISKYSRLSDVVALRTWHPQSLYDTWGSCLCLGFIYVRAGRFGIELVKSISSYMKLYAQSMDNLLQNNHR